MAFIYAATTAMILKKNNNPVDDKLRVKEQYGPDPINTSIVFLKSNWPLIKISAEDQEQYHRN